MISTRLAAGRRNSSRLAAPAAALLGLALLSGCGGGKKRDADAAAARASRAAEQDMRAIVPSGAAARFRGIQVYPQAMPGRFAVCGQVSPFADDPGIFVPFVSVIADRPAGSARLRQDRYERHVGTTPSEAGRAYLAIVEYCYNKGGPEPGPLHSIAPMPPLPDLLPTPAPAPPASNATISGIAASGRVEMRRNGNLHARPHGRDVRVVPEGTAMRIFSTAPGGWYEVGDTSPWGWVHESLLKRR